MSRALLLWVALGLAWGGPVFAQGGRDRDKKGGHPLAERSGSLEDLLFEKDWPVDGQPQAALPESQPGGGLNRPEEGGSQNPPVPRPAVEQLPVVPPPAANVGNQLQDLIRERNGIVDAGKNLLAVLRELNTEEQTMAGLVRQRSQAEGNLSARKVALNQALAMGDAAPPGAAENARNQVENAALHLRNVMEQCARQWQKMQPLYARVNPAMGPWFACYGKMRALFSHDRQDPNRGVLLPILEAASFYLTCENEKVRNPGKARDLIAKVPAEATCWQILRARAALAAEDGKWDQAVDLIKSCGNHCPPTIEGEVAAQQKSYEAKEPWLRTRPG